MKQKPIPGEKLETSTGCPSCHKLLDGYTSAETDGKIPKEGNVSLCFYCGEILIFSGTPLTLRQPTTEEQKELAADTYLKKLHTNLLLNIASRRFRN